MKQTIFFLGLVCGAMAWGAEHAGRAKLEALAAKNDTAAQFELAHALYWASGMDRDLEASAKWASRAAKSGNVKAQFLHAVQLLLAHGVEGDSTAGFELLSQTHPKLEQAAPGRRRPSSVFLSPTLSVRPTSRQRVRAGYRAGPPT